jgi:L-iditol 2-dehydrogenase
MAQFVRIPAGNLARDTLKIPPGMSYEEASFIEPLATVVKAFRRGKFQSGQSILVVGLGTVGHLAARLARAGGASRIAGADRVAFRIAKAKESGSVETFHVDQETIAEGARRLSGGRGFDFVFVGPGKSGVVRSAFDAAAPGGTLLLFTMTPPDEEVALPGHDLYFREVSLVPSYSCGPDDTREALELLAFRRVAVADLVTHRFSVGAAPEAFARARDPNGSIKVVITFE